MCTFFIPYSRWQSLAKLGKTYNICINLYKPWLKTSTNTSVPFCAWVLAEATGRWHENVFGKTSEVPLTANPQPLPSTILTHPPATSEWVHTFVWINNATWKHSYKIYTVYLSHISCKISIQVQLVFWCLLFFLVLWFLSFVFCKMSFFCHSCCVFVARIDATSTTSFDRSKQLSGRAEIISSKRRTPAKAVKAKVPLQGSTSTLPRQGHVKATLRPRWIEHFEKSKKYPNYVVKIWWNTVRAVRAWERLKQVKMVKGYHCHTLQTLMDLMGNLMEHVLVLYVLCDVWHPAFAWKRCRSILRKVQCRSWQRHAQAQLKQLEHSSSRSHQNKCWRKGLIAFALKHVTSLSLKSSKRNLRSVAMHYCRDAAATLCELAETSLERYVKIKCSEVTPEIVNLGREDSSVILQPWS